MIVLCEFCGQAEATGNFQLFHRESGKPVPGLGPAACDECARKELEREDE